MSWVKSMGAGGREYARREAERLALTGAVGNTLASLLGMSRLEFCVEFRRENLNSEFNGKAGKGDVFNRVEGIDRAKALLDDEEITKYVLLGANVAMCFAIASNAAAKNWSPLSIIERGDKSFLCLPHPSGINTWYNDQNNKAVASKTLKEFVS